MHAWRDFQTVSSGDLETKMHASARIAALLALTTCCAGLEAQVIFLPEKPGLDAEWPIILDKAGVIESSTRRKAIEAAQIEALEKHDTPIVVVTITRMTSMNYPGMDIEDLAKVWFEWWNIDKLGKPDCVDHRGILVLVAVENRELYIRLGKDWGKRFDSRCKQIITDEISPHFKQQQYGKGIAAGVRSLTEMAAIGPAGDISQLGSGDSAAGGENQDLNEILLPYMFFGGIVIALCLWVASALGIKAGSNRSQFREDENFYDDGPSDGGDYDNGGSDDDGGGAGGEW